MQLKPNLLSKEARKKQSPVVVCVSVCERDIRINGHKIELNSGFIAVNVSQEAHRCAQRSQKI